MNEEEKEFYSYRFSGYQPPLIKLDQTGLAYWVEPTHEYYNGQPAYWAPAPANRSIKSKASPLVAATAAINSKAEENIQLQISQLKKDKRLFQNIDFKKGKSYNVEE